MVKLRKLSEADAGYISDLWGGEHPLPGYDLPADRQEMEKLIRTWNQGVHQGKRFDMLLIELDGQPAGLISLYGDQEVSLGVCVHPDMQRKGAATGAVLQAMEYVRSRGGVRITSQCRADNAASIALHKKCGLHKTGRLMNRKGNEVITWEYILQQEIGASGPETSGPELPRTTREGGSESDEASSEISRLKASTPSS